MSDKSPLVRQWILLRSLASRRYGVTVRELAQTMGVSEKTIRRDLDLFMQAGFPLEETIGERGKKRWKLSGDLVEKGLPITYDEAIALHLARCLMEPLAGTMFWAAAQRAFSKIRSIFNDTAWAYVEKMAHFFCQTHIGVYDYAKKAEFIDRIMIGIEDRRAIQLRYRSLKASEPATYQVYPYGLTYHRGALYLVGLLAERNEIRHWKVNRVEDIELRDQWFDMPRDFSLQEHLAKSFGIFQGDGDYHIRVRFSPVVARYVSEASWHASQKLHPQRDGSLIADFDLDSLEEIQRWLLSFGKHAEVLEPEELRDKIRHEIEEMVAMYSGSARGVQKAHRTTQREYGPVPLRDLTPGTSVIESNR
ncbi:MAG: helix-turn-helix transcriptional regulator [Thermogutta sp.]